MAVTRLNLLRKFRASTPARPTRNVVLLDQADDTLPFGRIECPDLRTIGKAWLDMPRVSGEAIPRWSEFSPADFRFFLDKFCVLKLQDWRNDEIEFSLYGTHPTDFLGNGRPLVMQDMRNNPLHSGNYLDIRDRAGRAVDNQAPQYVRKTLSWNDRNYIEYETLMLPFIAQDGVHRVLQPVSARARLRLVEPDSPPKWCEIDGPGRNGT